MSQTKIRHDPTAELSQTLKEEPMPKWFSFFKSVPKSREY